MPNVPPLLPGDAPADVRAIYDEFREQMGFPAAPNFILTQGHSPSTARGTWGAVRNNLIGGTIPRWMKEMMFIAISKDRDCVYCTAAHIACCRMLGVDVRLIDELLEDVNLIRDPQLRTMIQFALKCSRQPQDLDKSDFHRLREQGLGQSEIMEVVAMTAFAVYANIIADATAMEPAKRFDEL